MSDGALHRVFETPGAPTVSVRVGSGAIRLDARGEGRVEIEVEPLDDAAREVLAQVRVDLRQFGDRQEIFVETPERRALFGRSPSFEIRVTCPERAAFEARTRSADVEARGRLGSLAVRTASGDVDVDEVEGSAAIQSASGDVVLRVVGGEAEVQTASGDLSVERVVGSLKGNHVSGDVTVRDARGPVEIHTVSGDQRLEAVSGPTVTLKAVSGDIRVAVRRGANVWLDVRSVSGDTSSDLLPSEGAPGDDSEVVELRVSTVSGDVRIERAAVGIETG